MNIFKCKNCSSTNLAYQKYVRSDTPIEIKDDGTVYYCSPVINDDDYLAVSNGFFCRDCGYMLEHSGCRMETEKDLLDYLTMDPEVRNKEQAEYEDQLAAMNDEQEAQQLEQDVM